MLKRKAQLPLILSAKKGDVITLKRHSYFRKSTLRNHFNFEFTAVSDTNNNNPTIKVKVLRKANISVSQYRKQRKFVNQ